MLRTPQAARHPALYIARRGLVQQRHGARCFAVFHQPIGLPEHEPQAIGPAAGINFHCRQALWQRRRGAHPAAIQTTRQALQVHQTHQRVRNIAGKQPGQQLTGSRQVTLFKLQPGRAYRLAPGSRISARRSTAGQHQPRR